MVSSDISKWGDRQQYVSEPMPEGIKASGSPKVILLNATPDPLGSLAALCAIYTGRVVRSLRDVTDEERRQALEDMSATELSGPLESIQFHFLIEGIDRSFTHQAVRGRNAFYGQESLRFAVPEGSWSDRTTLPPSLAGTTGTEPLGAENTRDEYKRNVWDLAIDNARQYYLHLVNGGMPAEEARGLLPHAIQTRYHWVCSLRELLHVAGLRTCTQAQFHWRLMMAEVANALREFYIYPSNPGSVYDRQRADCAWQFELIADLIRPVCYQTGRCGFMAKFDRDCSIRDRVERNARANRPSSKWDTPHEVERCTSDSDCPGGCGNDETITLIEPIRNWEWAADPGAARK